MSKRGWKMMWLATGLLIAFPVLGLAVLSWTAKRPDNIGIKQGRLSDCPDSPNCVCSQATDESHTIEPIQYEDSPDEAMAKLLSIIAARPRASVVTQEDRYLHVEINSQLFRFTDDVEFLIDEDAQQIHVRSASRVGHSDFGVNRKRIEAIRRAIRGQ
jgi:uncharacterized protein (DUF1499 family)